MSLPLSVLDLIPIPSGATPQQALKTSLSLVKRAEELGYVRYWVAEHHNTSGLASASPEIMIAMLAKQTERIRVGAGGVMLPNHSPLKVAEDFRLLEALFPGRIDLGLGRAPGTDPQTAFALRRSMERMQADDFEELIEELEQYGNEASRITAIPSGVTLPPLWLLSSSGFGARLAAALGRGLAFAHHFAPDACAESMAVYRAEFRPSPHLREPHAILTVSAICAETEERAQALARAVDLMWLRFQRGERGPLPTVEEAAAYKFSTADQLQIQSSRRMTTVGTPEVVKAKLLKLATEMKADELMISTHVGAEAERLKSFELIAQAFNA